MDKEHKININPSSTNKAQPTRHPIVAILFQIGIRLRFLLESWMGFKLFFCGLAGYPSPYRPANCPKYDLLTQGGFALVWIFTGLARETGIPYLLLAKTGLIHLVIGFHDFLCNRLMNQLKASNYTTAQRNIPIPEYDWETGSPEEFYQIFVKRPHPVVLRGFMRKTSLVTRLTWQNILTQFGNEDVFLTKKELDGFPGKLKEVDNPKVYLHNSEVLFQKYPEIRDLFQYERLEPYMHMKVGYEQIFVGRGKVVI
ncbi:hypothetical protein EON65_26155 [archaeon]|nr:MAG: hypothetical protein EON65_26155 [archaeon]